MVISELHYSASSKLNLIDTTSAFSQRVNVSSHTNEISSSPSPTFTGAMLQKYEYGLQAQFSTPSYTSNLPPGCLLLACSPKAATCQHKKYQTSQCPSHPPPCSVQLHCSASSQYRQPPPISGTSASTKRRRLHQAKALPSRPQLSEIPPGYQPRSVA